jgi:hypothetical protein
MNALGLRSSLTKKSSIAAELGQAALSLAGRFTWEARASNNEAAHARS